MNNSRVRVISSRHKFVVMASMTMLLFAAGIYSSVSVGSSGIRQSETVHQPKQLSVLSSKPGAPDQPSTPNPYLSFLPVEAQPDYPYWRNKIHQQGVARRKAMSEAQIQQFGSAQALVPIAEAEAVGTKGANDTYATAEYVSGFGSGAGSDPAVDITGNLKAPTPPVGFTPLMEDEGDIGKASMTNVVSDTARKATATIGDGFFGSGVLTFDALVENAEDNGQSDLSLDLDSVANEQVTVTGEIGNGPHGSAMSGSGDFDFYELAITDVQVVDIAVAPQVGEMNLDPVFAVYRNDGSFAFAFDNSISITFTVTGQNCPCTASWFIAVGGKRGGPPVQGDFPSDPLDSSTGPGAGDEGLYELTVTKAPSGDFDFYSVVAVAGDLIEVEIDTDPYGGVLDSVIAIYDSAGFLIALNDDDAGAGPGEVPWDSYAAFRAPYDDTFYIEVGGYQFPPFSFSHFLSDPFNSASGPGVGSEGDYDIIVSMNDIDLDHYTIDLQAGDIIGANVLGADPEVALIGAGDTLLAATAVDVGGMLPGSGTLPGGGDASLVYIIAESGRYAAAVGYGSGAYTLELRVFRPPQEASGTRQKLFVDFDGETVDPAKWGGNPGAVPLSPLSAFIPAWGLIPSDENDIIDAILAVMEQNLSSDIKFAGNNLTFDIEILNSRDDPDPFGDPDVSRVIIGGTIAETGIDTIGIAQSVDPGNFDQSEDSLVLLDLLSAGAGNPNSLNTYAISPVDVATKIAFIGVGVGNIAAHEAGHFFADFHTDNQSPIPNIMDAGGNMAGTLGIGPDLTFGTGDDIDVNFGLDEFDPTEIFFGVEDTRNSLAFSLTTGPAIFTDIAGLPDINSNGFADVAVIVQGASSHVHIRDGSTDALITDIDFGDDPISAMVVLDDISGNGMPEIALLGTRPDNNVRVQVKDSATGATVNNIFYGTGYSAIDMAVLPDTDSNGADELAVVGASPSGGVRIQARDALTDAATSTTFYGDKAPPVDVVTIPDVSANGKAEVLMHGQVTASGQTRAQMRDSTTSTFLRNIFFGNIYSPVELVVIQDVSGDGVPDLAHLGVRNDTGAVRIQVKRSDNGGTISNAFTGSASIPIAVIGIGDANGNTFPDVAMLVKEADGTAKVIVRDGATGDFIRNTFAASVSNPVAMALVEDLDSSGDPELAILGDSNGTPRVQIKDSISGAQVNTINFP